MKKSIILAAIFTLAALGVQAQDGKTNTPAKPTPGMTLKTNTGPTAVRAKTKATLTVKKTRQLAPNKIVTGNGVVVSGVLVQIVKTDNPLQLINPFAPASYGNASDNTAYDPVSGRGTGIKAISFDLK